MRKRHIGAWRLGTAAEQEEPCRLTSFLAYARLCCCRKSRWKGTKTY